MSKAAVGTVVGVTFSIALAYKLSAPLWIAPVAWAATILFATWWAYKHFTEKSLGDKFTIEPQWEESQQSVWSNAVLRGEKQFELQTALKIRFCNGDDVPRIVKTANLFLLRRRRFRRHREIAKSSNANPKQLPKSLSA